MSSAALSISACSVLLVSFISDTCFFVASASSFLPSFISIPMDFDREFTSARFLSNRFCVARLLLFNSSTWAIVSFAFWKCFFSKPAITRSVSSVINFNVSITKYELFFIPAAKIRIKSVRTVTALNFFPSSRPDKYH